MLDAGHLNSNTDPDQSSKVWPFGPLATQHARAKEKIKLQLIVLHAYAPATQEDETTKVTGSSAGEKFFNFVREVKDPKSLSNFFSQQMSLFFKLISQVSALVYIDGIPLMSKSKPLMLNLFKQLQNITIKKIYKELPKFFPCLLQ